MKKKLTLLMLVALIISIALMSFGQAAVSITANSSSNVGTETFSASATVNESSTGTIYVYSNAARTTLVTNTASAANSTTHSYTITGLTGGTQYWYNITGASRGVTYNALNTVTTDAYQIQGVSRTILNIFVLMLIGIGAIVLLAKGGLEGRTDATYYAGIVLGAIILGGFVTAVLAA